jgi:cyclopropane-fatty-acyl-phospholipid synthase
MNDASVGTILLPPIAVRGLKSNLARRAFFKVLSSISVGNLVVHEGGEAFHFGAVEVPSDQRAEVTIQSPLAYRQILVGGSVGAGEAFMQGHWSSPDLVTLIRLFSANMAVLESMDAGQSALKGIALRIAHALNRNSVNGSRRNISAHYDLGNEFFELFLDKSMMYSSAVFPEQGSSLETAAEHKLDLICQQLQLSESDHLLEIGTGWGGMAIFAARKYGCRVTTTTISREQYQYACQRVQEEGLQDRITLLCEDYRNLDGSYDKLVSIEMIEAVGHRYYQNYFNKCSSLLKPTGLMAIQAITMVDQRYEAARDQVDFIKRYIFPGGCLPSVEIISNHLRKDTDMQAIHLRDITDDYADTLEQWRLRFFQHIDEVRRQGFDTRFERMWEFYLCYCEGAFRERVIGTVQMTFAKPGYRFR